MENSFHRLDKELSDAFALSLPVRHSSMQTSAELAENELFDKLPDGIQIAAVIWLDVPTAMRVYLSNLTRLIRSDVQRFSNQDEILCQRGF